MCRYEVAKFIKERSHGLVFGINTFLALVLQSILTAVVIRALKTDIRNQVITMMMIMMLMIIMMI